MHSARVKCVFEPTFPSVKCAFQRCTFGRCPESGQSRSDLKKTPNPVEAAAPTDEEAEQWWTRRKKKQVER